MSLIRYSYAALLCAALAGCGGGGGGGTPNEPPQPPANRAPAAVDDSAFATGQPVIVAVLNNDSDPDGDEIRITAITQPDNGTAAVDDNGTVADLSDDFLVYTPAGGYSGPDSFTYTIIDGLGGSATGTVSLVTSSPVTRAGDDYVTTPADTQATISVLDNDFGADGNPVGIVSIAVPQHGVAVLDDNGTPADTSDDFVRYTPDSGYTGPDSFVYLASDGTTTDSAAVNITVGASGATVLISGRVSLGPVAGAHVSVYTANDGGLAGSSTPLVETTTDLDGFFAVLVPAPSGAYIVTAEAGDFADVTENSPNPRRIFLNPGDVFSSYLPAGETFAAVTVFTDALLRKGRLETDGNDFGDVFANNRSLWTQAFGFDVTTTDLANPRAPGPGAGGEKLMYAMAIGGAANAINGITDAVGLTLPDYAIIRALMRDFSDCQLDGADNSGPIAVSILGTPVLIPTNIDLNAEILRFRNNNFSLYENADLVEVNSALCAQSGGVPDTIAPVIGVDALTTGSSSPALTGTIDDPSATIQVTVDGNAYAAVNSGTTWMLAAGTIMPPLADGVYDVVAAAQDPAGNTGTDTTTDELTIDSSVPTVSADVLATSDSSPALSGTVDDPAATIVVSVGGSDYPADNNGDGTWTLPDNTISPPLGDGSYDITVTATNALGFEASNTVVSALTVDTVAPAITIDPILTTDTTPALTGTVSEANALVVVNVSGNDYNADVVGTNWTLPDGAITPPLPQGQFTITVTATDPAGNETVEVLVNGLSIDLTAPMVTVNSMTTSDSSPELTGTVDDPAAAIQLTVDGNVYPGINNGDGTWTLNAGSISPALADGTYDVAALATDPVGNSATDASVGELVIDSTVPVVTVDLLVTNDSTPPLTGTVSDTAATIVINVDGTDYPATNVGDGTWLLPDDTISPALTDGSFDVTVDATNLAMSTGSATIVGALQVDTVTPSVTIDPVTTMDTTPALSGTVSEPGTTVSVNVNGNDYPAVVSGGLWSVPDNTIAPPLTEGSFTITVTATDPAGNSSDTNLPNGLSIDLTAPTATFTSSGLGDSPELNGTINDPAATIVVTVAGNNYPATNNGDATWTLPAGTISPPLADGNYNVTITATDAVGNVSVTDFPGAIMIVGNTSPIISGGIPADTAQQGVPYGPNDVSTVFSDPDGDPLTFSLFGRPAGSGLTIDPDTGVISGTPTAADALAPQPLNLVVEASDSDLMVSGPFDLTVIGAADLDLAVALDNEVPEDATPVVYTITLTNNGAFDADNITVTVAYPEPPAAGLTGVAGMPDGGTSYDDATREWTIASLTNGSSVQLVLNATVSGAPQEAVTMTTTVTAVDQPDPDGTEQESIDLFIFGTGEKFAWTGASDNDWFNPANWDCGLPCPAPGFPGIFDEAEINDVVPNPPPVLNADADIGILDMDDTTLDLVGNRLIVHFALEVTGTGAVTGTAASTVEVLRGTARGTVPTIDIAGPVKGAGDITTTGDLIISDGPFHQAGHLITVAGDMRVIDSGILLHHHGNLDTIVVAGDVTFEGGDHGQPDAAHGETLRDGRIVVGGDFVQQGHPRSYAAEDKETLVFAGSGHQTVYFQNPDNSNPAIGDGPGTGSRIAVLEIEKDWTTDGSVELLSDLAVLKSLDIYLEYKPRLEAAPGSGFRVIAGGADVEDAVFPELETLIMDNVPITFVEGGAFGTFDGVSFINMDPAIDQIEIIRDDLSGLSEKAFGNLRFETTPTSGHYIYAENTDALEIDPIVLTIENSLPELGAPRTMTVNAFDIVWGLDINADTDGDGVEDKVEYALGTSPLLPDSDGDGLADVDEQAQGTDGTNPDTDGDGIADGLEILAGSDPLFPAPASNKVYVRPVASGGNDANSGTGGWANAVATNARVATLTGGGTASNPIYVFYDAGTYEPLVSSDSHVVYVGSTGPGQLAPVYPPTTEFDGSLDIKQSAARIDAGTNVFLSHIAFVNADRRDGGPGGGSGGGLFIETGAAATVESSVMTRNRSKEGGAGFFVNEGGELTLSNSLVNENASEAVGGGAAQVLGRLTLRNSILAANESESNNNSEGGGALWLQPDGPVLVEHTLIFGNHALSAGGAVYAVDTDWPIDFFNVLISGNAATEKFGGAFYLEKIKNGAALTVASATIAHNEAIEEQNTSGGLHMKQSDDVSIVDTILWFNRNDEALLTIDDNFFDNDGTVSLEYSNVEEGDFPDGSTNEDKDPDFEWAYYLADDSKSLDAGSQNAVDAGLDAPFTTQLDGAPDEFVLDHGFHYQAPRKAASGVLLMDEAGDCDTDTVTFVFALTNGRFEPGAGHVIGARLDAAHTAGGTIKSLTSANPFGDIGAVLARDLGDGRYSIQVEGILHDPGDVARIELVIDNKDADPIILESTDLSITFAIDGC